ncbi:rhodanese-like domain-containing protein [Dyadobacter sp. 50-39]|uniref:rhodanese-like domain-containing protein n=1 Tax=Dyadobacter sp. 50-39 TaxID=1895756 RepID=UPI0025B92096|nr:rhodanese-like domain-containing protein [Dyadobacter sp. 50-39]
MKNKCTWLMLLSGIALLATTQASLAINNVTLSRQDSTQKSDSISVADLKSLIKASPHLQIIDARLLKDFDRTQVIPGAKWRDPTQVTQWAESLDKTKPVVIYCVHGHKVSQQVVDHLRQSGFTALRLTGGIEEWKEQKGATVKLK